MEIFRIFHLQCARRLPALPATHPCSRVHGHSFEVRLSLVGEPDPQLGWVMDFGDVDRLWETVHAALDHRYLNDIAGLENPTSEQIAIWLWNRLVPDLKNLSAIAVLETPASGCIYHGPSGKTPLAG